MSEIVALRYQVAKTVGWNVRKSLTTSKDWYYLVRPNGTPHNATARNFETESAAWETAPDYDHDVDACMDALDATNKHWLLVSLTGVHQRIYRCTIQIGEHESLDDVFVVGTTRCEAMCKALLAYAEVIG